MSDDRMEYRILEPTGKAFIEVDKDGRFSFGPGVDPGADETSRLFLETAFGVANVIRLKAAEAERERLAVLLSDRAIILPMQDKLSVSDWLRAGAPPLPETP